MGAGVSSWSSEGIDLKRTEKVNYHLQYCKRTYLMRGSKALIRFGRKLMVLVSILCSIKDCGRNSSLAHFFDADPYNFGAEIRKSTRLIDSPFPGCYYFLDSGIEGNGPANAPNAKLKQRWSDETKIMVSDFSSHFFNIFLVFTKRAKYYNNRQ